MIVQVVVVAIVLALWLWLIPEAVRVVCPDRRLWTRRRVLMVALLVVVAAVAITLHQRQKYPEEERLPLPCKGDGVDYDTRDGLCYKFVPKKYQRY